MTQATLPHRYDKAADWWQDRITALGYAAAYRAFLAECSPADPGHVADIGCGSGAMAAALGHAGKLTLVDPSAKMLAVALGRFRDRPDRVQARLETLPGAARFDTILLGHVIEHCPDPAEGFVHVHRLLAPGGQLCLVASKPHLCQWLIWLHWQHRWFAPDRLDVLARRAGLVPLARFGFPAGPPKRTSLGMTYQKPQH